MTKARTMAKLAMTLVASEYPELAYGGGMDGDRGEEYVCYRSTASGTSLKLCVRDDGNATIEADDGQGEGMADAGRFDSAEELADTAAACLGYLLGDR